MATYIFKRLLQRLFSGIGRSGYPRYYTPNELDNPKNLPVVYDVSPLKVYLKDLENFAKEI